MKAFADREEAWRDISRIVAKQSGRLDRKRLHLYLAPLVAVKGNLEALKSVEPFCAESGNERLNRAYAFILHLVDSCDGGLNMIFSSLTTVYDSLERFVMRETDLYSFKFEQD